VLGNTTDAAGASTVKDTGGPGGSLTVNSQFGTLVYTNNAAAQAYAGTATVTLAADGVYTIAVRVFDGAGNSTVIRQQVRLTAAGPRSWTRWAPRRTAARTTSAP